VDDKSRRRKRAVDGADEPQLLDARKVMIVDIAVVQCVFGYASRDGDCEFLSLVGLGSLLEQSPALSVRCLTRQGEIPSGRVGVVQVDSVAFVGVCGVCEHENSGSQLDRKLEEPAVFLAMSLFGKTCKAGGSYI
jgi:hypothetical protein